MNARSAGAEQLIDAAIELIARHGYAGMSVEALCRKAGIVKSGLYWHFGSKEGLLRAVIDRVTTEWIEDVRQSAEQANGAIERLDRALAEMHRRATENPEVLRVMLVVLLERSAIDPESRAVLEDIFERAQRTLVQGMLDAICFDVPDIDMVAGLSMAMFHGIFLRYLIHQDQEELARLIRGMREAIVLLIEKRLPQISRSDQSVNPVNSVATQASE